MRLKQMKKSCSGAMSLKEVKMEYSLLFAMTLFAFVMSVTPGPNNIMLLASGAQFGYRRTLPHIFGIIIGVALLLACVLVGLGIVFELYPVLYSLLKGLGCTYLLCLAWRIATAPTDKTSLANAENKQNRVTSSLLSHLFLITYTCQLMEYSIRLSIGCHKKRIGSEIVNWIKPPNIKPKTKL
jgi:threonine/homoserine/homoserine lactone efflux protein